VEPVAGSGGRFMNVFISLFAVDLSTTCGRVE
jgi:hypothetical protein